MFVTGCHRSGTSLLAAAVSTVLATPRTKVEQQLPAALDNPGGFHESADLVSANDALLASLGASWDQPPLLPVNWRNPECWPHILALRERFSTKALSRCWVDKDPRLSLTLSAYQHILLRRPGCVVVLREPCAVAKSLYARDGIPITDGLCLWWVYNLHLAHQIQSSDMILLYESIVENRLDAHQFAQLADLISSETHVELENDAVQKSLLCKVRPEWRRSESVHRHKLADNQLDHRLLESCNQAYSSLKSADPRDAYAEFTNVFASLPAELIATLCTLGWQGWPKGHRSPQDLQNEQDLHTLSNARLWRLTAPIRAILSISRG